MTFFAQPSAAAAINPILSRLKRQISARGNRRHAGLPWTAAPAYAASTAYELGQRVTNAGNVYTAYVAGTTGAASAPTGTGPTGIADNTVTWFYVGPAFASDAMAPTYSVSSSAPALGKFYRNAAGTFASGAAVVVSNDNWFEFTGHIGGLGGSGFANFVAAAAKCRVAFLTDAPQVVLAKANAAGYGAMIAVNGRYLVDGNVPQSGSSGTSYTTINLRPGLNLVELFWPGSSNSANFKGVYVPSTGTVSKPPARDGGLRALFVGDSYSVNTQASENLDLGIAATMCDLLGIDDLFIDGLGGTGFVAGSTNYYLSATRLGYITSYAPNVVIVMASVNDSSDVSANFGSWYNSVRGIIGTTGLIIVLGVMGRSSAESAREAELRVAIAAKIAAGDSNILFVPASGDAAGSWMTGTGKVDAPTGTGNGDLYFSTDNTHPVGRGYDYLGRRAAAGVQALTAA